jgi:hypothetical protein
MSLSSDRLQHWAVLLTTDTLTLGLLNFNNNQKQENLFLNSELMKGDVLYFRRLEHGNKSIERKTYIYMDDT